MSDVDKMTLNYNDKNKNNNNNTLFYERRKDNQFAYSIQFPSQFDGPGNKPVKTHLDEVNFQSNVWNGYQFGITIDPVRIQSLSQFGTPPEVAAKVVLAELKRDGIMEVTLMKDPIVSSSSSSSLFSSDSNNNKNLNNSNERMMSLIMIITCSITRVWGNVGIRGLLPNFISKIKCFMP